MRSKADETFVIAFFLFLKPFFINTGSFSELKESKPFSLESKLNMELLSQGSILGPLFFLLYINDLPHATNFETTIFADDINFHLCHSKINTLRSRIKCEIVKSNDWMSYNKVTVNYKKAASCLLVNGLFITVTLIFSLTTTKLKKLSRPMQNISEFI